MTEKKKNNTSDSRLRVIHKKKAKKIIGTSKSAHDKKHSISISSSMDIQDADIQKDIIIMGSKYKGLLNRLSEGNLELITRDTISIMNAFRCKFPDQNNTEGAAKNEVRHNLIKAKKLPCVYKMYADAMIEVITCEFTSLQLIASMVGHMICVFMNNGIAYMAQVIWLLICWMKLNVTRIELSQANRDGIKNVSRFFAMCFLFEVIDENWILSIIEFLVQDFGRLKADTEENRIPSDIRIFTNSNVEEKEQNNPGTYEIILGLIVDILRISGKKLHAEFPSCYNHIIESVFNYTETIPLLETTSRRIQFLILDISDMKTGKVRSTLLQHIEHVSGWLNSTNLRGKSQNKFELDNTVFTSPSELFEYPSELFERIPMVYYVPTYSMSHDRINLMTQLTSGDFISTCRILGINSELGRNIFRILVENKNKNKGSVDSDSGMHFRVHRLKSIKNQLKKCPNDNESQCLTCHEECAREITKAVDSLSGPSKITKRIQEVCEVLMKVLLTRYPYEDYYLNTRKEGKGIGESYVMYVFGVLSRVSSRNGKLYRKEMNKVVASYVKKSQCMKDDISNICNANSIGIQDIRRAVIIGKLCGYLVHLGSLSVNQIVMWRRTESFDTIHTKSDIREMQHGASTTRMEEKLNGNSEIFVTNDIGLYPISKNTHQKLTREREESEKFDRVLFYCLVEKFLSSTIEPGILPTMEAVENRIKEELLYPFQRKRTRDDRDGNTNKIKPEKQKEESILWESLELLLSSDWQKQKQKTIVDLLNGISIKNVVPSVDC